MKCDVVVANDGVEGVKEFNKGTFDLVLMDINMPHKDGYQTTKDIRSLSPPKCHIPIVAVTAYAMEGDREKCLDAGMNDYISKPIDFDLLEEILKKHLGE
jgi:CheY-like chemotaxis protein